MRRAVTILAVVAMSVLGVAPSASAAGQLCYDVDINVNGNQVTQADCIEV
jgi:hypothetical protein